MICCFRQPLAVVVALLSWATSTVAISTPTTYYSDRTTFLDSVRQSITDDFSDYTLSPDSPIQLTDDQMSAVLGETRYEAVSFPDLNLVGNVYVYGDGTNYCAGCNGNFTLYFDSTSFSRHDSVFGVAVDIVLHTSRHSSLGDVVPGDASLPGTVLINFSNGDTDTVVVPADVGFFGPQTFFLGLTDPRGIFSMTFGIEPLADRHSWVIDNLTVATQVAEPSVLALIALGLVVVLRCQRVRFRRI